MREAEYERHRHPAPAKPARPPKSVTLSQIREAVLAVRAKASLTIREEGEIIFGRDAEVASVTAKVVAERKVKKKSAGKRKTKKRKAK
jgi:hypothetical protein